MERSRIAALLAPFVPQPLPSLQVEQIATYLHLLLRWNQRMNLTAIRDPEQIVTRHFGESFFAASRLFPSASAPSSLLVDVGSGAGFPGLAIRIHSRVPVTLIESTQRKATFLREVVRALRFDDVEVFAGRSQQYRPHSFCASLTVTMRAVESFEQALSSAVQIASSSQLGNPAPRVPARLALLVGAGQVDRARQLEPNLRWEQPISIPQSRARVLLVGSLPRTDETAGMHRISTDG